LQLKAIELQGFKSFANKTRLVFPKPVTVIVGPNGCGKSNIADAVLWVMGEQSPRALRGGKMEDVIFGGTKKRNPTGFAEVELTLAITPEDVIAQRLPAGFAFPENESELAVSRRYYRSGESEYRINKKAARLRDVSELLMDTGLGKEGYSVIGQGRIDEILSTKSEDRRAVFEEAAGISKFRHRKEESERRLRSVDENLTRVSDKIAELELQVEPLRAQAEVTRKYLGLKDKLRELELSEWKSEISELEQKETESKQALSENERGLVRAQTNAIRYEKEIAEASEAVVQSTRQLDALRAQTADSEKEAAQALAAIEGKRELIAANTERAERDKLDAQARQTRKTDFAGQIDELNAQIADKAEQSVRLEGELETALTAFGASGQQSLSLEKKRAALLARESERAFSEAGRRALVLSLSDSLQESVDRETQFEIRANEMQAGIDETAAAIEKKRAELSETEEELTSNKNVIAGLNMRAASRKKAADEAASALRSAENDLQSLRHKTTILRDLEKSYEGYSRAVREVTRAGQVGSLRGILGTVGSLMRVDSEYALAVETALGAAIQNIITDTNRSAKDAIYDLKRRDLGRATFLPLDTIEGRSLDDRGFDRHAGYIGLAVDLCAFDEKYSAIYANLLGRCAIVETLDDATELSRETGAKFKVVTLDGQVVNSGGSLTGGSNVKGAGILSRAGELAEAKSLLAVLEKKVAEFTESYEVKNREATAATSELSARSGEIDRAENVLSTKNAELSGLLAQLTDRQSRLAEFRAEGEAATEKQKSDGTAIEELNAELRRLEAEKDELQQAITAANDEIAAFAEQKSALDESLAVLRQQIAQAETERRALEAQVAQLSGFLRETEDEASKKLLAIEEIENQNKALEAEIAELQSHVEDKSTSSRTLRQQEQTLLSERLTLEGKKETAEKLMRSEAQSQMDLEREKMRLERNIQVAVDKKLAIIEKMWEEYEFTVSALQAAEFPQAEDISERLTKTRREISALGTPNLGAIEEFARVSERYVFLTDQRDDVLRAKDDLLEVIASITGEMEIVFTRKFAEIREKFLEVFSELFGGGEADLVLLDTEEVLSCGIEIKVQPPGKSLKTLSLLSGGERAFAAVALYFAMLKVNPAPFVILDEIEAALDESNVLRLAKYMRKISGATQLIVVSHRRGTMEEADTLYGVMMPEKGVSRILTLDLPEEGAELVSAAANVS
jgi:chromosome segregation protein